MKNKYIRQCVINISFRNYRCCLLYTSHGDSDGLGGLVVDRYADVLSPEVSTLAVWQRLDRWLPLLHRLCGTKRHVVQVDEGLSLIHIFA